jgi:lipoprotein-anchoring transpeptidase ErfK/SrfK
MASGRTFRVGLTLGAAIAVVLLGAGAYAFGPARADASQQERTKPATGITGESASPRPEPSVSTESARVTAPTSPTATATAAATAPPKPATPKATRPASTQCAQGERQRDVETYLSRLGEYGPVTVDGVQSEADCAAITKFQRRFGISPAKGRAGPATADVARRIATSTTATERAKCNTGGAALVVCVDLTQQTAWAVRDGAVVWGPTVVRTGMSGYATPAGRYKVFGRSKKEWSVPYKVWLPWWQAFNGGIGFHETTTYIHDGSLGSHGCVNLLRADAVSLWNLTSVGTTVRVFGSRPGT